jgi:CHASE2 domain-containing sensor protein
LARDALLQKRKEKKMSETLFIIIASLLVPVIVWAINQKLRVKELPALLVTIIIVALLAFVVHWLSPARGFFAYAFDFFLIYAGSNLIYQLAHYINRARGATSLPRTS